MVVGFLVSKFIGFLVSWFLGFLVSGFLASWFLDSLVSWFLGFSVSKFLCFRSFEVSNDPISQSANSCSQEEIDPRFKMFKKIEDGPS